MILASFPRYCHLFTKTEIGRSHVTLSTSDSGIFYHALATTRHEHSAHQSWIAWLHPWL